MFSARQDVDPPIHSKSPEKPYSVYSRSEKWAIVIIASVAGLYSGEIFSELLTYLSLTL